MSAPPESSSLSGWSTLVLDNLHEYAVIATDTEGTVLSWHPGVLAILGYEEADFVGRSVEFIFTEEDRAAGVPAAELRQAEEAGRAVDERWHRRADGSRFWASGVLSALRSDGSLIGFVKILRDATERKRAEQALADSEQKFAKAFELAPLI